jgi:hypothetical protein
MTQTRLSSISAGNSACRHRMIGRAPVRLSTSLRDERISFPGANFGLRRRGTALFDE